MCSKLKPWACPSTESAQDLPERVDSWESEPSSTSAWSDSNFSLSHVDWQDSCISRMHASGSDPRNSAVFAASSRPLEWSSYPHWHRRCSCALPTQQSLPLSTKASPPRPMAQAHHLLLDQTARCRRKELRSRDPQWPLQLAFGFSHGCHFSNDGQCSAARSTTSSGPPRRLCPLAMLQSCKSSTGTAPVCCVFQPGAWWWLARECAPSPGSVSPGLLQDHHVFSGGGQGSHWVIFSFLLDPSWPIHSHTPLSLQNTLHDLPHVGCIELRRLQELQARLALDLFLLEEPSLQLAVPAVRAKVQLLPRSMPVGKHNGLYNSIWWQLQLQNDGYWWILSISFSLHLEVTGFQSIHSIGIPTKWCNHLQPLQNDPCRQKDDKGPKRNPFDKITHQNPTKWTV